MPCGTLTKFSSAISRGFYAPQQMAIWQWYRDRVSLATRSYCLLTIQCHCGASNGDYCILIGVWYLYGVMDGEVFPANESRWRKYIGFSPAKEFTSELESSSDFTVLPISTPAVTASIIKPNFSYLSRRCGGLTKGNRALFQILLP
jgi:hypothetical protein